ncbi:alpha-D-ribose 1-methylphosphonate 5-triphosphate diphosphatase [Paraburkholderia aspalathi]|uniref:Alpha-D-ribose 1-methylphosphonate 5-triphosphate diphosphatase n=1 Tax=Paraburkholderia aspalathi TaxID=1324617 RepID=A0A1I7B893_9BURK|nr:alpha-D-ribose 1-methylphosphonate 5-triphosphate diphosphatase [Paraburkholderia aspalathi]SFT83423.1 alpha-D-ribose 1-methylphosphonate 5-triphosphate diphosphatase [Paraburkholderia aspalathi]
MLIKNARIVTPDEEFVGVVRVENGRIDEISSGTTQARDAEDWDGDYLLPGFVELHTDNLEKHLGPRPNVTWNAESALLTHDAQVAVAGITTVFDSLAIGTRSAIGIRNPEQHYKSAEALTKLTAAELLRVDHYIHLRCEVATQDIVVLFDGLCTHPLMRLASVMDHTPGQRQWADRDKWRRFSFQDGGITDEQFAATLAQLTDEQRFAEVHRAEVIKRCAARTIPVMSHDDTSVEHVECASREGLVISEFPVTLEAAKAARTHGLATMLGAPNVVRGGSHSGNVSALDLAEEGLLDILSSDYIPSSLMMAVFELQRKVGWSLPRAIATVSEAPATAVGLNDRGAIKTGLRADFVRVRVNDNLPVPRATYVLGQRVA